MLNLSNQLLNQPRHIKRLLVSIVDAVLCVFSLWIALYLRLGEFIYLSGNYILPILSAITLSLPIFTIFGLYRAVFRYSGWPAMMTISKATIVYGLFYSAIFTAYGVEGVPRTVGIIQPIILFLMIGTSRATAYYWLGGEYKNRIGKSARERVLIYGAGSAGRQISSALNNQNDIRVIGFLDDNKSLIGQIINGIKIYDPKNIEKIVTKYNVNSILLALPSITRKRRQEIIERLKFVGANVKTLPSVKDLIQGRATIKDIKELEIDDLLGREAIELDLSPLELKLKQKTVLITGAGGSIGSELCRQIIGLSPQKLILVDHSEFSLYKIDEELKFICSNHSIMTEIHSSLTSVKEVDAIEKIFSINSPNIVFHAAAYKHVPLVEINIIEAIKNNIFGTKILAEAALKYKVENFMLISTDKAVRPTNIMGATKRWSELIIANCSEFAKNNSIKTKFSSVRFGNVLGSSGSVVPLFKNQIKNGGPITLTHPDVTRYFMSIPEAVGLVLQATTMADNGDVFLLDMGDPVKIYDLAKNIIQLSGLSICDELNPDGDISIEIIGLRPGEKLHEELLIYSDNFKDTKNPKIRRTHENNITAFVFQSAFKEIEKEIANNNEEKARKILFDLIKQDYQESK